MAKRTIIWTKKAQAERIKILTFWIECNKSKTYSLKLNKHIQETVELISQYPFTGRLTSIDNVRIKRISHYLLFYEITVDSILILMIRDSRRNDKNLIW